MTSRNHLFREAQTDVFGEGVIGIILLDAMNPLVITASTRCVGTEVVLVFLIEFG